MYRAVNKVSVFWVEQLIKSLWVEGRLPHKLMFLFAANNINKDKRASLGISLNVSTI